MGSTPSTVPNISLADLTAEEIGDLVGTVGSSYLPYRDTIINNGIDGAILQDLSGECDDTVKLSMTEMGISKYLHRAVLCSRLRKLTLKQATNVEAPTMSSVVTPSTSSIPLADSTACLVPDDHELSQTKRRRVSSPLPTPSVSNAYFIYEWGADERGRQNHELVRRVNGALKARGLYTWFEEEKEKCTTWPHIANAIEAAHCTVTFITREWCEKMNGNDPLALCKMEFKHAAKQLTVNRMIVVVMEEDMRDSSRWEGIVGVELAGKQFVNLSLDDELIFDKACDELFNQITSVTFSRANKATSPSGAVTQVSLPALNDATHTPQSLDRPALSASNGTVGAIVGLAKRLETGLDGITYHHGIAFQLYEIAAEQGDGEAMVGFGRCYKAGVGTAMDKEKAVEWFRRAREGGCAEGGAELGWCYLWGEGVTRDDEGGVTLLKEAAAKQNARAMAYLGNCYSDGRGVVRDLTESMRLAQVSQEKGDAYGAWRLGCHYYWGKGVTQDYDKAVRLFKAAAETGCEKALAQLGYCYHFGEGVAQDYKEAIKWYKMAVDFGDSAAINNLGTMHDHGLGTPRDMKEAVRLYKLSMERGNAQAMNNLAILYAKGDGVKKNMTEAVRLFKLAVEAGDTKSMNNLAVRYANGDGVEKDVMEAVRLYEKAVMLGNDYAMNALAALYETGMKTVQNLPEAIRLYKLAVQKGNKYAMRNLASCYERGFGVEKNEEEAKRLREAAEK